MHGRTRAQAVVFGYARTQFTRAVATHNGHFGLSIGHGHAEQVGHLPHNGSTADGTKQPFERAGIGPLHQGSRHAGAARITASAAIGTGQKNGDLRQARVFMYSEFLGAHIQHYR